MNIATSVRLHKAAWDGIFSLPPVLKAPDLRVKVFSAATFKKQRTSVPSHSSCEGIHCIK